MTGHQEHPGTGHTLKGDTAPAVNYESLLASIGIDHVTVVDPWNLDETEAAISAGLAHPGPAVVIARHHCMLLPVEKQKPRTAFEIDVEQCILCEECFETGCPALTMTDDTPTIRAWECAGCAMCQQLCPVDAIAPVAES